MLKVFAISTSKVITEAVKVAVGMRYPEFKDKVQGFPIRTDEKSRTIDRFRECAEAIEREIQSGDLVHDRFIGVLDFPRVEGAKEIHSLSSVQGMLILAFPEIQWVPLFKDAKLFDEREIFKKIEEEKRKREGGKKDETGRKENTAEQCEMNFDLAVELCKGNYTPLFDGDGLRGHLMRRVHGWDASDKDHPDRGEMFTRHDIALVVDEEPHFVYMNSYTAYRFGYRVYPIPSGVCADKLLREPGCLPLVRGLPIKKKNGKVYEPTIVAFEDVCLQFPDRTASYENEVAFGSRRDENFKALRDCHLRVVSTASQEDEKFVKDAEDKNVLPGKYFKDLVSSDGRSYRLCDKRRETLRQRFVAGWAHLKRRVFNICGDWFGYWFFTSLDFAVVAFLLIGTFFWKPAWAIPVVVAVFVFRGLFGKAILHQTRRLVGKIPFLEKMRTCRQQKPFMPLTFVNHDTQKDVHDHNVVRWCVARKPLAGIFGLRNYCGLPNGRGFKGIDSSEDIKKLYRTARTKYQFSYEEIVNESGHAAPGAAQEVATFLLRRCERMKDSIIDADGAIHAAVLATVATELLNYKTPALSIEALHWKHYYEVRAECEFVGVRNREDMEDRYIDIHNSLRRICASGSGKVRAEVFNSGAAELMDALVRLLTENGKLDEAAFFVRKSRMLHRRLLRPIAKAFFAYPEWVLRTPLNFYFSICGFFLLFWICWYLQYPDKGIWWAFGQSMTVVISRNNVEALTPEQEIVVTLAKQVGILHLAFLASNFMTFMQRK